MIHELKTLSNYFKAISKYEKMFDVRKKDRNFQVGDLLALNEILDNTPEIVYTGNSIIAKVDYILDDENYCKEGYIILGIKPCNIMLYDEPFYGLSIREQTTSFPVYHSKVGENK